MAVKTSSETGHGRQKCLENDERIQKLLTL